MTEFTPVAGAVGGVLIGLSAALGYLALGKVTGISGIVGRGLTGAFGHQNWGLWFLVGLIVTPWVVHQIAPSEHGFQAPGTATVIAAGLLVGYGTRMGSGCTSGHGICGMARVSVRSIVATMIFVGAGVVTVAVMRHVFGVFG